MDYMGYTPAPPSESEVSIARESGKRLATHVHPKRDLQVTVDGSKDKQVTLTLPAHVARLLLDILNQMAEGNAVSVIPIHAELTTQQAATLLNVSRPFLIGLLQEGKLKFHKVGTHRRIKYKDLLEYKKAIDTEREKALDELAAQAQQLNMGYGA